MGAVILTGVNSYAVGTKLDDFDSFASNYATTGALGAGGGLTLGINSATTVNDGTGIPSSEPIVAGDTDVSFVGLVRRATLTSVAGTGTSDLYNGTVTAGPTYNALGTLNYNNGSRTSTATLVYTFPSTPIPSGISFPTGVSLTAFSQFDFDFILPEPGLTLGIAVASATSGEGTLTGSFGITSGVGYTGYFPFGSLAGNPAVWDSVRSITFTLNNSGNPNGDVVIDAIGFSNPNVPEASVTIPSVAFAAGMGFFAWRRRQSK